MWFVFHSHDASTSTALSPRLCPVTRRPADHTQPKSPLSVSNSPPDKIQRLSSPHSPHKSSDDMWGHDDFEGPPRRITRKAFAEEMQRSMKEQENKKTKASGKKEKDKERKDEKQSDGNEGRSRRDSLRGSGRMRNGSGGMSSDSGKGTTKKDEKGDRKEGKKSLSERVSPPSPILIPNSATNGSVSDDTPSTTSTEQAEQRREVAVNDIFAWSMLPAELYAQVPSPPSLVYGSQHLLRLFGKFFFFFRIFS